MKSMFIYAGLWHIQFNKLASVFSFDGEMPSAFSAFFFFLRGWGECAMYILLPFDLQHHKSLMVEWDWQSLPKHPSETQ